MQEDTPRSTLFVLVTRKCELVVTNRGLPDHSLRAAAFIYTDLEEADPSSPSRGHTVYRKQSRPDTMFRFSVDDVTAERANKKQLASNNITRDEDWEKGLEDTGDGVPGEWCFRAETKTPRSIDEAVAFVRGHFTAAPSRVWIGDELYQIETADDSA